VLASLPLFLFKASPPSNMKPIEVGSNTSDSEVNEELINNSTASSQMSFGSSITELPSLLMNMFGNKIFMAVTFTSCSEFSIVVAFLTFMPKYIQDQFSVDPSVAAIMCGGILLPAAGIGIMTGGFFIRKYDLNMFGCAKMALISSSISFILFIPAVLFTCGNAPIAGVNVPYPVGNTTLAKPGELPLAECNDNCNCDSVYQPICSDEITYQNPCFAGCKSVNKSDSSFFDCSCISTQPVVSVALGACDNNCTNVLIPYLIAIFFITMVTCCAQTPAIFITLRCVNEDERPIAMGCQYLLLRLLA
jgi:organic anion transporter 5A